VGLGAFRDLRGLSRGEAREQDRIVRIQEATDLGWRGVLAHDRTVLKLLRVSLPANPHLEIQPFKVC
jgi:hypothetical protein